jgi:hypothetical protein
MLLNEDEWVTILDRLVAVTEKRSLEWQLMRPDDAPEDHFWYSAAVGETNYSIGAVDGDGVAPFYLQIDRNGVVFDQIQTPSARLGNESQNGIRNGLRDLYREIGRAVNRAPERVALLIADLAGLEGE